MAAQNGAAGRVRPHGRTRGIPARHVVAFFFVLFLPLIAHAIEITAPVLAPSAYPPDSAIIASNGATHLALFRMNGLIYASVFGNDGRPSLPHAIGDEMPYVFVGTGSEYVGVANVTEGVRVFRYAADGTPIARSTLPLRLQDLRLAWNGRNLLLTGREVPDVGRLDGFLLARDGSPVADLGVVGPLGTRGQALTAVDGDFVLATASTSGLNVFRISGEGVKQPVYGDPAAAGSVLSLAARRESIVVTWAPQFGAIELDVVANGALARRELPNAPVFAVATTSGYLVVRQLLTPTFNGAPSPVEAVRLDRNGQPVDEAPTPIPTRTFLGMAAAGDLVEILTLDNGDVAPKLTATWLHNDRPLALSTSVVSVLPRRQLRPVAASAGIGFLTAFLEMTADTIGVSAARFSRGTTALDGAGIGVGSADLATAPALASDGGRYLAIWSTSGHLLGSFIAASGTADPPFLIRETTAADPALVWNGANFFALWASGKRIYGATISPSGVVGDVRQISPEPSPKNDQVYTKPALAWDGARFVTVWLTRPVVFPNCGIEGCVANNDGVMVEHVDADGQPIESDAGAIEANSPAAINAAHLASAGMGNALVTIDFDEHVETALVHGSGVEIPRVLFQWMPSVAGTSAIASDLAVEGAAYVVVWRFFDPFQSFIAMTRLPTTGGGTAFSSRAVVIGRPDTGFFPPPIAPALVTNGLGETAVVVGDVATLGDSARVHAYFSADMAATPPPPAPPHNVTADLRDGIVEVTWAAVEDAQGFAIQYADGGIFAWAPAGATHAAIGTSFTGSLRVRAYNTGGLSAPSAAVPIVVHHQTRRRAARG